MLDLAPRPCNFAFQRDNARFQLGNGEPVQILSDQLNKGVIRTRRGVVQFHARQR